MMISFIRKVNNLIEPLRKIADLVGSPVFDLSIRLYMAYVFFKSGLSRFQSYLKGSWDTEVFLFDFEHPVPGLDPSTAATITTAAELILPVFLAVGLFARFGAAGMLAMTAVITFTYSGSVWFESLLWFTMLGSVFVKGPGMISADYWLVKWLRKNPA